MKNILIILKKELKRVFTDRRMLMALFLPGVLIFALYSLMGGLISRNVISTKITDTTYRIAYSNNYNNDKSKSPIIVNNIISYVGLAEQTNKVEATSFKTNELTTYQEKLVDDQYDLLISFTDNFEEEIMNPEATYVNVSLFYNGKSSASSNLYTIASSMVAKSYNRYSQNIDEKGKAVVPNLAKEDAIMNQVISFVFPIVTISILYSTIASLCPEAIAGEKERGTLASILLTPIKRKEFVMGKMASLIITAILSGVVSFVGIVLSLPKLMNMTVLPINGAEMFLLFLIIVSMLLFFVALGVLVSALANTIKEAGSYLGPLSIVFMLLSFVPSLTGSNLAYAFIPVLNLSASMQALLTGTGNIALLFGCTIVSNIIYTAIFIFFVSRLFEKEKVVLGH